MYMPPPAMIQAMMAPNGPVAPANVRGNEKMPAPTMDPTTMAVRTGSESFWTIDGADGEAVAAGAVVMAIPSVPDCR